MEATVQPPSDCVALNIQGSIAYVQLNRPKKHNGLNDAMMSSLIRTAKQLRKNRSIRCVVVHGIGPSFCAGLDFAAVSKKPSVIPKFFLKLPWTQDNGFQRVAHIWQTLPMPVIAAIHGNCFGGGLQIALGCDYRIATPDSQLSIMESKWGLIPDMSATVTLSRLIRIDTAFELTTTGRIFSGTEAETLGIVSRLDNDPLSAAQEMANAIANKSPTAVAAAKVLYQKTWKKGTLKALLWERLIQLRLLGRYNQRTAMKNALSKNRLSIPFRDR